MLVTKGIGKLRRLYYSFINRLILYKKLRWAITITLVIAYIQTLKNVSYDIATYLIGFYLLQLLIGYFTPRGVEQDIDDDQHQQNNLYLEEDINQDNSFVALSTNIDLQHSEDKPLTRSLTEMEIWERATFAFILGFICSYFKMIQIDVFWPLLLIYFIVLVCYTIQKILKTMDKYKYGLSDFTKMAI